MQHITLLQYWFCFKVLLLLGTYLQRKSILWEAERTNQFTHSKYLLSQFLFQLCCFKVSEDSFTSSPETFLWVWCHDESHKSFLFCGVFFSSAGSFKDGLSGSCGQASHGLCAPYHGGGGGGPVEGAGREARQSFPPADGRVRSTTPWRERCGRLWGVFVRINYCIEALCLFLLRLYWIQTK